MTNGIPATLKDGVYHWDESDNIIPPDVCKSREISGLPGFDMAAQKAAYSAHLDAFCAEYRRINANRQPSAEERAEARAAHGPGVVLVDIITGKRWTT